MGLIQIIDGFLGAYMALKDPLQKEPSELSPLSHTTGLHPQPPKLLNPKAELPSAGLRITAAAFIIAGLQRSVERVRSSLNKQK